ncbi:MAG: hypothetical protein LBR43_00925 [Spiroplasmataceae bacterium]|nr:hypothetical protein [Spiroplasmataceae bacterium]
MIKLVRKIKKIEIDCFSGSECEKIVKELSVSRSIFFVLSSSYDLSDWRKRNISLIREVKEENNLGKTLREKTKEFQRVKSELENEKSISESLKEKIQQLEEENEKLTAGKVLDYFINFGIRQLKGEYYGLLKKEVGIINRYNNQIENNYQNLIDQLEQEKKSHEQTQISLTRLQNELEINNQQPLTNKRAIRKNIWVDTLLWNKINNYINGQLLQSDFNYRNFSDFLRQALISYQKKELQPISYRVIQRKQIGINLDDNLNSFYLSLPTLMKTQIINDCLNSLLIKESQEKVLNE